MLTFFRQGPIISLYAIIISILASPFLEIGSLQLWMIVPGVVALLNWKYLIKGFKKNIILSLFFVYTLLTFSIYSVWDSSDLKDSFFKQLLFTSSFLCFFLTLSYQAYFAKHYNKLVNLINTIIVVTCLYGIYQSMGRLFDLPFTGNEYLDFRKGRIAGLIQISSFFKEPALFSQFLLCVFFIHAFVLEFKYKWVIALIIINVILTISVSGYISVLILFFLWLSISASNFLRGGKINKQFIYIFILMAIGIGVFLQSELFVYIYERFSSIFKFVNPEFVGYDDGSVDNRTGREGEFVMATLNSSYALTGFGVNYSKSLPARTLALNGIAEVIIRWGIIGLFIFVAGFFKQIKICNNQNRLLLVAFLILYVTLDGAIAKPAFWTFLAFVFLFNQLKSINLKTS